MGETRRFSRGTDLTAMVAGFMGRQVFASDKEKGEEDKGTRRWEDVPPLGMNGGNGGDENKPQRERSQGGMFGRGSRRHGN